MARCTYFHLWIAPPESWPPSRRNGKLISALPSHPLDRSQANTMLSYPLPEAYKLLSSKLETAQTSLGNIKQDLSWLRDQITVTEVNVARVYNWDVKRRRERREAEQES